MMIDPTCVLAACCFIVGNAISIAYLAKERQKQHFDYAEFTNLDPEYIQQDWAFRVEHQPLELAGGFINAFSWLFFSIPMLQAVIILSRGGTRQLSNHMFIAVLILTGCAMEFLARFMHLGMSQWGNWLSTEYNLDNWVSWNSNDQIGWRVLEVSHLVSYGTVIWIDSFEFLCLGLALVLFYASVNSLPPSGGPVITRTLAGFGLFIGLFSLADFIAGVLRLRDWRTFAYLTMLISVVNRLVLFPIFLLVLGCQLPTASRLYKEEAQLSAGATPSREWDANAGGENGESSTATQQPAVEMVAQGE